MATEKTRKTSKTTAKKPAPRARKQKSAPEKAAAPQAEPPAPLPQAPAPKPSPVGAEVPLVGLEDVAKMLRISPLQVRQMVQSGRIPGVKVEGEWRFNKDLVFEAFHRRSRGF
ncbi:MAG: helix-turn-helix domain-containing protein [Myxococcales bacterium]|nr:helix-turn-helix domain-containing protein [Myxococcales bacterium]